MSQILQLHSKIVNPSSYIVDIGASAGTESDPVWEFVTNEKYRGLCIEGLDWKVAELKTKTKFDIYNGYITPDNALELFKQYDVPINLDILKIDIDGYDLEVLRTILRVYKPRIIIAEINEKIPPPILFEVNYSETYKWDESHFFGFSIQSGEAVMNIFGYKILNVYDLINILCIDESLCDAIGCSKINDVASLYKKEYVDNPERNIWYNEDVNHWLDILDADELQHDICRYFCASNPRSLFSNKIKTKDLDFTIGIQGIQQSP